MLFVLFNSEVFQLELGRIVMGENGYIFGLADESVDKRV